MGRRVLQSAMVGERASHLGGLVLADMASDRSWPTLWAALAGTSYGYRIPRSTGKPARRGSGTRIGIGNWNPCKRVFLQVRWYAGYSGV